MRWAWWSSDPILASMAAWLLDRAICSARGTSAPRSTSRRRLAATTSGWSTSYQLRSLRRGGAGEKTTGLMGGVCASTLVGRHIGYRTGEVRSYSCADGSMHTCHSTRRAPSPPGRPSCGEARRTGPLRRRRRSPAGSLSRQGRESMPAPSMTTCRGACSSLGEARYPSRRERAPIGMPRVCSSWSSNHLVRMAMALIWNLRSLSAGAGCAHRGGNLFRESQCGSTLPRPSARLRRHVGDPPWHACALEPSPLFRPGPRLEGRGSGRAPPASPALGPLRGGERTARDQVHAARVPRLACVITVRPHACYTLGGVGHNAIELVLVLFAQNALHQPDHKRQARQQC